MKIVPYSSFCQQGFRIHSFLVINSIITFKFINEKTIIIVKNNSKIFGHLACFIAYAIFGINIIICKDLTDSNFISPLTIFCMQSIGAGAIFWIISLSCRNKKSIKKIISKFWLLPCLVFFLLKSRSFSQYRTSHPWIAP